VDAAGAPDGPELRQNARRRPWCDHHRPRSLRVSEPEPPPVWPYSYSVAPSPHPNAHAPSSRYTYAPPSHRGHTVIIGSIVAMLVIAAAAVEVSGSRAAKSGAHAGHGVPIAQSAVSPTTPAASNPTNTPTPPNTAAGVTASSPLSSPRGTVIFADDFSDPNSGWDTGTDNDSTYSYTPAGYSMTTHAPAIFLSYAPDDTPAQQVSLSITAVEAAGADPDAGFGVSCRRGPDSASQLRYEFTVTGAGRWFIERNEGDLSAQRPTTLREGPTQLPAGTQVTVSAVCATLADGVTTRLALFLNGTKVADMLDVSTVDGAGWLGAIMSTNVGNAPATTIVSRYNESALGASSIIAANT
jgi:hypothetical protein